MSYNEEKEHVVELAEIWRPTNVHDRFCRATVFDPFYAPDFLRNYCDSLLAKYVHLDNLQKAPTVHLSKELKEVHMDALLSTRLLDPTSQSEILLHLEHKSKPSTAVGIQMLLGIALTLHIRWDLAKRPEKGFVAPIPLMILVYNGSENWSGIMDFSDIFPNVPLELFPYTIRFKIFVVNLRRFRYGNLPGEPQTQAITESLMRATDGTFNENLTGIMRNVARSPLDGERRTELAHTISVYNTWSTGATSEQIINAITTAFRGQEGIKMAETINNSLVLDGIKIGEERGKAEGKAEAKAEAILTVLRARFLRIPLEVLEKIHNMTDPIALDSHISFAATCPSMKDFADSLK